MEKIIIKKNNFKLYTVKPDENLINKPQDTKVVNQKEVPKEGKMPCMNLHRRF